MKGDLHYRIKWTPNRLLWRRFYHEPCLPISTPWSGSLLHPGVDGGQRLSVCRHRSSMSNFTIYGRYIKMKTSSLDTSGNAMSSFNMPHYGTRTDPMTTCDFLRTSVQDIDPSEKAAAALASYDVVIVPGLDGSNLRHWQSRWEILLQQHGASVYRVQQNDWMHPFYPTWKQGLLSTLRQAHRRVILVAHSLGAILVARVAAEEGLPEVAGAFLVAPADIEQYEGPAITRIKAFEPLPRKPLPFPAIIMASENDEWLSLSRAHVLATEWKAELVNAGTVGHIGNVANIGMWRDGLTALTQFADNLPSRTRAC